MIEIRDLTKMYGDLYAVNRLHMKLERGDVYGFIGPNGSGKTTTMRMLGTLLAPTWGEATVCGYSIYTGAKQIRRLIGFMPDTFGVYDDMKVMEYLEFYAAAYRINGPTRRRRCEEVLELVDLSFKRDAMATSLSHGMTQRLGLARVLLHDPEVLLLDEPARGLDPRARIDMRNWLRELGRRGKTIMVSSHILPELADICNKVGIIERGELLFDGDVQEAMNRVRPATVLNIRVSDRRDEAMKLLEAHPNIRQLDSKDGTIVATLAEGVADGGFVAELLVGQGFRLTLLKEEEINLETAFMRLTKGILQ